MKCIEIELYLHFKVQSVLPDPFPLWGNWIDIKSSLSSMKFCGLDLI